MAFFIELHNGWNGGSHEPILVNVESISYISPASDDGCYIHFVSSRCGKDSNGGLESIHVHESYTRVKNLLKDYD